MSNEIKAPESSGAPADPIKNLKAELDRKLVNSDAKLTELQKTNELLIAKLNEMSKSSAPGAKSESMSDLLYSDPEKYAKVIEERAEQRAVERMTKQQAQVNKVSSVVGQLTTEFPELNDSNHQLTKRAIEIYQSLPDDEKNSSLSYKLAVKEAAEELSIKPKSKRPVDEEPSFGSSYSRSGRNRSNKLDSGTEAWAEIFGLDTSKSEVKERLIAKQSRNWTKYEPVKKGK